MLAAARADTAGKHASEMIAWFVPWISKRWTSRRHITLFILWNNRAKPRENGFYLRET